MKPPSRPAGVLRLGAQAESQENQQRLNRAPRGAQGSGQGDVSLQRPVLVMAVFRVSCGIS